MRKQLKRIVICFLILSMFSASVVTVHAEERQTQIGSPAWCVFTKQVIYTMCDDELSAQIQNPGKKVVIKGYIDNCPVETIEAGKGSKRTTEIVIPATVKKIEPKAIRAFSSLKKITVAKGNKNYKVVKGKLIAKKSGKVIYTIKSKKNK